MLDRKIFNDWFVFLEENYGKKTAYFKEVFYEMVKDIEDKDFKEGIKKLLKSRVYTSFPSIADVRNYCLVDRETRAIMAWDVLYKSISRYGAYKSVCFDDKIIHMLIDSFSGWIKLCSHTITQLEFIKREFIKNYQLLCVHPRQTNPYFLGIVDSTNKKLNIQNIECSYLSDSERENQVKFIMESDSVFSDILKIDAKQS